MIPQLPRPTGLPGALDELGRATFRAREGALDLIGFVGLVTAGIGRIAGSLKRLRLPSIVRHVYETGLTAVPIVSLIAFLIAVIVAYIGAQQLRKFGGEIFVVDLVTVSVLRELGVLLTAIIVAGRSGSAFAAEIGAMKLNDEVDALRAMGMDPVEVLVLPRIFGLVIALPILTIVADAMGLAGRRAAVLVPRRHSIRAVRRPRAGLDQRIHVLGRHDQGPGLRRADRTGRHAARHAGAHVVARARPADHRRGRAIDLPRDPRRRRLRRDLHGARHLMAAVIEVRGIVNRFGRQVVHDGLDVDIEAGEVFGIVGGSGSGKSVLLRTMLGLQKPASGSVRIEGEEVTGQSDRELLAVKRRYGVMFQRGALFSSLSVAAERRAADPRALPDAAEALLQELALLRIRMVGLGEDAAAKYPAQLSGGMTKRAALARALALDPGDTVPRRADLRPRPDLGGGLRPPRRGAAAGAFS